MQNDVAHTPEPWAVQPIHEDGAHFIIGCNLDGLVGAALAWSTEIDSGDFSRVKANARRIVAAINATAGIPTEALEAGVVRELVDALRFYARPQSWRSCGVYMSGRSQATAAEIDSGKRAADALAKAGAA